jgi:hypothetical protein
VRRRRQGCNCVPLAPDPWQSQGRNFPDDPGLPASRSLMVWEGDDGKVRVSYNAAGYFPVRHNLPPELVQNISVVEALAAKAAECAHLRETKSGDSGIGTRSAGRQHSAGQTFCSSTRRSPNSSRPGSGTKRRGVCFDPQSGSGRTVWKGPRDRAGRRLPGLR